MPSFRVKQRAYFSTYNFWHQIHGFSTPSTSAILCRHLLGALKFNSNTNYLELVLPYRSSNGDPQFRNQPMLLHNQLYIGGSHDLLLKFDNLQEWQANALLTVSGLCKGYNSITAKWKKCTGQGMQQGLQSFHALSEHTKPSSTSVCSSTQKLPKTCCLAFLWKQDWLNHWSLVIMSISDLFHASGGRGVLRAPTP